MEGINSLFVSSISMPDENLPENFLATVGAVYDDGLSLILEGQTEATTKHYKCNTSATFAAGDRVKVARISGSYVVEYVVGPPSSGGTTSAVQDRIKKGDYGIYVNQNFVLPIYGNERVGAANVPFNGMSANGFYVCYNASKHATLTCNSNGKLLVNGTVIG